MKDATVAMSKECCCVVQASNVLRHTNTLLTDCRMQLIITGICDPTCGSLK
jgi:hypothetical protein